MKILFKYPTIKRPEWFLETLEKYYTTLSEENSYEFVISMNEDDETMNNQRMKARLDSYCNLRYFYGPHKSKIEAVNADIDKALDFDILFIVSDDMIPTVPGFDVIIAEDMKNHFPKLDGALHYNDGCCGLDKCITLSIMGRELYRHFGYVYHPDYLSLFCDEEFTNVVYFPRVIVKHEWKGGNGADEVYKKSSKLWRVDQATFKRRKKLGFPK